MEFVEFVLSITRTYWGRLLFAAIFVVALIAVLVLEKEKIKRFVLVYYSLIIAVFIYNPVTYIGCRYIFRDSETFQQYYVRFFSLLPVFVILAYVFMLIITKFSGVKKLIAWVCCLAIICLGGTCVYGQDWYTKADNSQKVPNDVFEIVNYIQHDLATDQKISILAPTELAVYMRQIEPKFSLPYTRDANEIDVQLTSDTPNAAAVLDYASGNGTELVVAKKSESSNQAFAKAGFLKTFDTDKYTVYELPTISWVLTQYPDDSGLQGSFYTMENTADKTLIVIDGGSTENEKKVRKVINEKGGKVDLWILTHYHEDHCGAFNAIAGNPQGIEITSVVASHLDQDVFYEVAKDWDDVETYDTFLYTMSGESNLVYVNRGDHLTMFDGLKISFFNAYDDVVKYAVDDIPNNCSLVFKIETANKSVLFCGDCHNENITGYMINTFGKELQADIMQVGHHGNNSMPTDTGIYEVVDPDIACFDAPEWLMTNEDYSAIVLSEYLENKGIVVKDFTSAPNYFAFY